MDVSYPYLSVFKLIAHLFFAATVHCFEARVGVSVGAVGVGTGGVGAGGVGDGAVGVGAVGPLEQKLGSGVE